MGGKSLDLTTMVIAAIMGEPVNPTRSYKEIFDILVNKFVDNTLYEIDILNVIDEECQFI